MSEEDDIVEMLRNFPTKKKLSIDKCLPKPEYQRDLHNSTQILSNENTSYGSTDGRNRRQVDQIRIGEENDSLQTEVIREKIQSIQGSLEYYSCDQDHSTIVDDNNITMILDKYKEEIDAAKAEYNVATPKTRFKKTFNVTRIMDPEETINLECKPDSSNMEATEVSENISQNETYVNKSEGSQSNDVSVDAPISDNDKTFDTSEATNSTVTTCVETSELNKNEISDTLNIYQNIVELLKKQNKSLHEKYDQLLKGLKDENETLKSDYKSLDNSFSELHNRYEKLRQMNISLRNNEKALLAQVDQQNELLNLADNRIEQLATAADVKLKTANEDLHKLKVKHESDIAVLQTSVKLEQTKNVDLEYNLKNKITQNEELTAICDELLKHANA